MMSSVSIDQWRMRIGAFSGGGRFSTILSSVIKTKKGFKVQGAGQSVILLSMLLVFSNITQMLLLEAGVERNPGPVSGNAQGNIPSYNMVPIIFLPPQYLLIPYPG